MNKEEATPGSAPESAAPAEAPLPDADIERLARGVEAARLVEVSCERIERARGHASAAKKGDGRRRCRDQLKRLIRKLREHQEGVLSKGVDFDDHATLAALLHALDLALDDFLASKPKASRLEAIRQAAKTTRKAL